MPTQPGRRIGYVDFKLDNFHADIYLKHARGQLVSRGFDVAGCYALDAQGGRAWAAKNGVRYCESVTELNDLVDYYCVLAPSNPELHLELCEKVFPFGKPTYVDKTFAPNVDIAREIFALADAHGVAMQTTSALRYTAVQARVAQLGRQNIRHMLAWVPGGSLAEYGVHAAELIVSCLGPNATRLMRRGDDNLVELLIDFTGGRTAGAYVYMNHDVPFSATITTAKQTEHMVIDTGSLFVDMASAMFDFFEQRQPSIDRRETLTIRRILDAATDPAALGAWVEL